MTPRLPDKLFLITRWKLVLITAAWVLSVFLHNALYGLLRSFFDPAGDEPFFFLLAVIIIPLYAVVCLVYSLVRSEVGS